MKREVIILSDLDLKIMEFLRTERFVKNISDCFEINYSQVKKHLNRLQKILCINCERFGTFKKIILNEKGEKILRLLKDG